MYNATDALVIVNDVQYELTMDRVIYSRLEMNVVW